MKSKEGLKLSPEVQAAFDLLNSPPDKTDLEGDRKRRLAAAEIVRNSGLGSGTINQLLRVYEADGLSTNCPTREKPRLYSSRTANIQPTCTGTGLHRQEKPPRDLRTTDTA